MIAGRGRRINSADRLFALIALRFITAILSAASAAAAVPKRHVLQEQRPRCFHRSRLLNQQQGITQPIHRTQGGCSSECRVLLDVFEELAQSAQGIGTEATGTEHCHPHLTRAMPRSVRLFTMKPSAIAALAGLGVLVLSSGTAWAQSCSSFQTCAQAVASMKAGNTKLDRDKGGITCESLCGSNGENMPR